MEPVRDELIRSLSAIEPRPDTDRHDLDGDRDSESTAKRSMPITGGKTFAKEYASPMRSRLASQQGFQVAIELGPHPTLTFAINECCQANGSRVQVVPSLRRDQPDRSTLRRVDCRGLRVGR